MRISRGRSHASPPPQGSVKDSFWRLPLRITCPPRIASRSPGPATTRLMKFTSARSSVGVAQAWIAEARADAVDQHALADLERRHHRLRRDPVRLDEERLDAERQPEGDDDDQDELEERAA